MIDWVQTQSRFGFSSVDELVGKRPKVVCSCDGCRAFKSIAIRVKSRIVDGQMAYLCPSCVGKRRSVEISAQLKKQWSDQQYCESIAESSRQLWQDASYRTKHGLAVRAAMENVDMASILSSRYANPDARNKLKITSSLKWSCAEFREKHKKSMSKAEVRNKISLAAKSSWTKIPFKNRMAEVRSAQSHNISSIQEKLYKILDDLNVKYHREGPDTKIGFYVFDCLIPDKNILIECQGDYWHSQTKAQMRDKQKFSYVNKYYPNHKIIYVWEREFYQADRVQSRLRSILQLEKIHKEFSFSDVEVRKIDATKEFLELYHYLGPGRGGIKYGAYLNGELIAVAVFSKPLRQNLNFDAGALECSRFCIHPNYQKRNFASWFLSRTAKQFPNVQLYSYADSTVGHAGTIYKAAGWKHHHTVPADYWYSDGDGFVMHKKTLYNRAVNLKMTESQFAEQYGYHKIHGGIKECFVYKYLK